MKRVQFLIKESKLEYLHCTNWAKENINLDQIYETFWIISDYWKHKIAPDLEFLQNIEPKEITELFKKLKVICRDDLQVDQLHNCLTYLVARMELLKEYIFEDIRTKEFPDLPSRRNCMFLIGTDEILKDYLSHYKLNILERNIVKIEIIEQEKKIVKVNPKFLNCNLMKVQDMEEQARNYWMQKDTDEPYCEYLFRGKFRIVEIIDPNKLQ